MEAKIIRNKLKKCQPYFVEKELLPLMYFKEDKNELIDNNQERKETEYWIFYYSFIRKLTDEAIGVRLGYTQQGINKRALAIIGANFSLIEKFLSDPKVFIVK